MTTIVPDAERCVAKVTDPGRGAWSHRCHNRAKPGTDRCGVHTKRERDTTRVDPTGPPEISVRVTTSVTARWPAGTGPIGPRPFSSAQVQWDAIHVTRDEDGRTTITGAYGVELKKDGTRSQRRVDARFMGAEDFPRAAFDPIRAALQERTNP